MGGKNIDDLEMDPHTWVDHNDLMNAGWSLKTAQGTFGSLVAEGLVYHYEDDLFSLTDDWAELRKYHA